MQKQTTSFAADHNLNYQKQQKQMIIPKEVNSKDEERCTHKKHKLNYQHQNAH